MLSQAGRFSHVDVKSILFLVENAPFDTNDQAFTLKYLFSYFLKRN